MTKPYPLRYSLPVLLLLFGAALTCFSIWDGVRESGERNQAELQRQLEVLGRTTAARLASYQGQKLPQLAEGEFALLTKAPHLRLGLLLDESNRVILSTDATRKGGDLENTPARAEGRSLKEAKRRMTPQIYSGAEGALVGIFSLTNIQDASSAGLLYLGMDTREQKDIELTRNFQRAGMICALALALVLASWLYLNQMLTKRVAALIASTRALAGGDFSQRTNLQGMDELTQLGDAFNQMAEQIQARTDALTESEERHRRIVETAYEGIFAVDANRHLVLANRRMAEMLGFTIDGLTGRPFGELLFAEDAAAHDTKLMRRQLGEAVRYEQRLKRKDGAEVWTIISAIVQRDEIGAFQGAFGMATDITERKRFEAQLQLQASALMASANGIVITDEHGTIEWINPAVTKLTGYASEEVIGKRPSILKSGHHPPEFYATMWSTIRAGNVWEGELINKRKDGGLYTEFMTVAPVRDQAGEIAHFVAIKEDVTEHRRLEAQLHQAQKMEAISHLAGSVAHGYNNLLTIIVGYASLLQRAADIPPASARMLQQIASAASRATDLTRQLALFSRRQPMQQRSLVLNQVLDQLQPSLKQLLGEDIRVHCDLSGDLPTVVADVGMIRQMVMNLAANARAAMPRGGDLTLTTRSVTTDAISAEARDGALPGRYVCLTVADNGCGMESAKLKSVFEPCLSAHSTNVNEGFGLAAVYGIVKQHSGWVDVTSRVGEGTRFRVFLPVGNAQPAPAVEEVPVTAATPPVNGKTILLVEDDPAVLSVTRQCLCRHGHRVLQATNGEEALQLWRSRSDAIDLLLTDIVIPGDMDGRDLANRLKQDRPDLKVLFSSGYSRERLDMDQDEHPASCYISKPYSLETLHRSVTQVFDHDQQDNRI